MKYLIFGLVALYFSTVNAALITPSDVSGVGVFYNNGSTTGVDLNRLSDGVIPAEGTDWRNVKNIYWQNTTPGQVALPFLMLNLGSLYNIDDILVSVDNNDDYFVDWSVNSSTWNRLFSIDYRYGEIGFGMDTMSTDSTHTEYVSGIDFSTIQAQYLRISASSSDTGGFANDNNYSTGEFQAFGSRVSSGGTVPEPTTLVLIGIGFAGMGYRRKRAM